jgi:uncharacterized protein with von Willebrand factor type A (vWA) domain
MIKNVSKSRFVRAEENLYSIKCDSFDRDAFTKVKSQATKLQELEVEGNRQLATFPPFMQDVYSALYKPMPVKNTPSEMVASHRYNANLVNQMMNLPEYHKLRAYTQMDVFSSAMATLVLGEKSLSLISDKDKEALSEMNNLEEQIDSLQSQVAGMGETIVQTQSQGQGQQAKKLAADQAATQMTLDQAKAKLNSLANAMDEQLQKSTNEMRQMVRKAIQAAISEVEESSDMLNAWGDTPGIGAQLPVEEKLRRAKILKSSPKMAKLATMVGRFKRLSTAAHKKKVNNSNIEPYDVKRGDDLANILPSEMYRLAVPEMAYSFYEDFADGNLLVYKKKGKEKVGKGPIVCCVDNSNSMDGPKELWSKAIALALLEIARIEKRDYACIHFGSRSELKVFVIKKGQYTFDQAIEIGQFFFNGGTDFEAPLGKAFEIIEVQEFKKADIVFVTDGECVVSGEFLKNFRRVKKEKEFRVISILVDMGSNTPTAVKEFSDIVEKVSELDHKEAMGIFEKI